MNFICEFCNQQKINIKSLRKHRTLCKENSNAKRPWNYGLTVDTDNRVKANTEKMTATFKTKIENGWKPYGSSEECWDEKRRKRHSEWRKQYHIDNPESHPNRKLANNRIQMSYPERIVFDWLVENKIDFDHNKKVGKYYPDFIIGSNIIEIDGERWHPENNENDRLKDEFFIANGYTVYRIRSKEKIIQRLFEIVKNII